MEKIGIIEPESLQNTEFAVERDGFEFQRVSEKIYKNHDRGIERVIKSNDERLIPMSGIYEVSERPRLATLKEISVQLDKFGLGQYFRKELERTVKLINNI